MCRHRDSTSPACRRSVALQVAEPCRLKALSVLHCHSMSPVEARYENGLLKPAKPLHLRPGEMVGLIVVRRPDPSRWDFTRLARCCRWRRSRALGWTLGLMSSKARTGVETGRTLVGRHWGPSSPWNKREGAPS